MMTCERERDVNASPDSTVDFAPQEKVAAKTVVRNTVGRIESSKITRSVSQYKVSTRLYQRAQLTEIFFVPEKVDPVLRWQPAVKGTATTFAGVLKSAEPAVKPVTRSRIDEILEGMRDRLE